ncbi:MAG: tripartite tricarboxylate transporter TctB family protein [Treponema sp.]|nr:tripartite tricarboxylate transporter TctB family protein [Treponema sp.]
MKNKDIQRMLIGLAIILVTAFLWSILGFLIVTPFTIFGLMFVLGKREWIKMAIISVAVTVVVFLAFRFLLGIEMPMGFLG